MPKGYEKMRDAFKAEGMGSKAAKGKAARIWNAKHPGNPVTRAHAGAAGQRHKSGRRK